MSCNNKQDDNAEYNLKGTQKQHEKEEVRAEEEEDREHAEIKKGRQISWSLFL